MKLIKMGAVMVIGVLGLSACSSSFDAEGTITLGPDGVTQSSLAGGECDGSSGYDDITPGAQVILSADGKTVGKGELEEAKYDDGYCVFPFEVTGVAGGSDFYSVEISHRGEMEYTQDELEEGVSLSLGS